METPAENRPDIVLKAPFAARYDNFIDGRWLAPKSGGYFDNLSPITGGVIGQIARSQAEDVEAALDAAHRAKDGWGRTPVAERALILNRIADRMEANLHQLALAETWDNGKPIRESTAADVPLAIDEIVIPFREGGLHYGTGAIVDRRLHLVSLFLQLNH